LNTVAGSTLAVGIYCNALPCVINSLSDGQGNTWRQATSIQAGIGISVWMTGPSSAAAETVTFTPAAGTTITGSSILELTNIVPGTPTTPLSPVTISNCKFILTENDNCGMFTNTGGFSASQTFTISAAGTTLVALWSQAQHGVFNSCVLTERVTAISGAGATLNTFLQDSADNVGFNDRLSMTQATTALGAQNLLGAIPAFTATALTAQANSAVVSTDGALAAGSGIAGPIGPFGRLKFVAGGTPSITIAWNVVCR